MKKISYIIALSVSLFATSCEKTLKITPIDEIPSDLALTDISGVNSLLASAYSNLRLSGYYGLNYKIYPEILADNIYPIPGLNSNRLITHSVNQQGSHFTSWALYTTGINETNLILEALGKITGSQAEKDNIKGQASGLRALFYWDMVKAYAYSPLHKVNNFDLGVPIVLTPTKNIGAITKPPRNTVEDVYKQIETDLKTAEQLSTASAPFYLSRVAAQTILAKVYLYWGKYQEAATYADKVIQTRGNTFVEGAKYADMFYEDSNPEAVFEAVVTLEQHLGNLGLQSHYAQFPADFGLRKDVAAFNNPAVTKVGYGDFTPSPELLALYEAGDLRRGAITTGNKAGTTVTYVRKYTPTKANNYLQNIVIFRISELYLIRAEANFRNASTIGATPQADLDKIRQRAGLTAVPVTLDAILKERRIELAFEGDRWFDLVRRGADIPKTIGLGAGTQPLPFTNFKILAGIPTAERNANPNLVPNPGYQ